MPQLTDLTIRQQNNGQRERHPSFSTLKRDVTEIKRRLGFGQPIEEIQDKLHLTRRQLRVRMRWIRAMANDASNVWIKYCASTETTLKTLSSVRQMILDELQANKEAGKKVDKQLTKQLLAIHKDVQRARKEMVEVGQSLGQYDRVPERIESSSIPLTLGDLVGEEPIDVEAETG